MPELLRQVKEQRQMQFLAGAAQAVAWLWCYQMRQMLAGVDAVATQSTYPIAQLRRVARLTNVNKQLTKLCHMTVDLHDELRHKEEYVKCVSVLTGHSHSGSQPFADLAWVAAAAADRWITDAR